MCSECAYKICKTPNVNTTLYLSQSMATASVPDWNGDFNDIFLIMFLELA
jgi:hypothetical protein